MNNKDKMKLLEYSTQEALETLIDFINGKAKIVIRKSFGMETEVFVVRNKANER